VKSPVALNVVVLVVVSTAFYTYVGQLVPQKELLPPAKVEISQDMTPRELAKIGDEIAHGKGLCTTCHTIGGAPPYRFPDLAGVADRAKTRVPGFSQLQYFAQTLCEPNAYVVPGFTPGMPTINKAPVGLSDEELHAVVAWLESQGGEPTITLKEKLPYCGAAG
jgi:mono/diheme cytochrome c family protein